MLKRPCSLGIVYLFYCHLVSNVARTGPACSERVVFPNPNFCHVLSSMRSHVSRFHPTPEIPLTHLPPSFFLVGNARFTVLTPNVIRMEYSNTGKFEDRPTLAVLNRNLTVPKFTKSVNNNVLSISTGKM